MTLDTGVTIQKIQDIFLKTENVVHVENYVL